MLSFQYAINMVSMNEIFHISFYRLFVISLRPDVHFTLRAHLSADCSHLRLGHRLLCWAAQG